MAKKKESGNIATGRVSICRHCSEPIAEDRDPDGTPGSNQSWYSDGQDYGCDDSPESSSDGCGPHEPADDEEDSDG